MCLYFLVTKSHEDGKHSTFFNLSVGWVSIESSPFFLLCENATFSLKRQLQWVYFFRNFARLLSVTSFCPQRTVQLKTCPPFCKRELPTWSLELLVRVHRSTPAEGSKALQGHPHLMSKYCQDPPVSVSTHQTHENHHIGQRPQASLSPLRLPRLPNG